MNRRRVMDRHEDAPQREAKPSTLAWALRIVWNLPTPLQMAIVAGFLILGLSPCLAERPAADEPLEFNQNTTLDPVLMEKLNRRGDLTLKAATITEAMFTISKTWGINVVVRSDMGGKVNGVFQNAPLHEILNSLLLLNGYSYRPVGQSLVVMSLEDVGDINPLFMTTIVTLQHGDPTEIKNGIDVLRSPKGKIHAIPTSKSLMVVDYPDRVRLITQKAKQLDNAATVDVSAAALTGNEDQLHVAYYAPQYIPATSLKEALAGLLSADGKMAILEGENRIMVSDYPRHLRLTREALDKLDIPRPQVRISAMIYDISLDDVETFGINWMHALKSNNVDANGNPLTSWAIDAITRVPPALGTANGIMTFLSMSENFDVTAVVNALATADDSKLLADPNVTVANNNTATISIVTEIPYQQLTESSEGGVIGTTSFREAGVQLEVTPRIAVDGTISMKVSPKFSTLAGFTETDNQPIINRREANTTVRVAHRQTLVIGGLRQRVTINERSGIPYLMNIPVVRTLFRARENTVRESELVVFITPEIIYPKAPERPREEMAFEASHYQLNKIPPADIGVTDCDPIYPARVDIELGSETPSAEEIPTPQVEARASDHSSRRVQASVPSSPTRQETTPESSQPTSESQQSLALRRVPPVIQQLRYSSEAANGRLRPLPPFPANSGQSSIKRLPQFNRVFPAGGFKAQAPRQPVPTGQDARTSEAARPSVRPVSAMHPNAPQKRQPERHSLLQMFKL